MSIKQGRSLPPLKFLSWSIPPLLRHQPTHRPRIPPPSLFSLLVPRRADFCLQLPTPLLESRSLRKRIWRRHPLQATFVAGGVACESHFLCCCSGLIWKVITLTPRAPPARCNLRKRSTARAGGGTRPTHTSNVARRVWCSSSPQSKALVVRMPLKILMHGRCILRIVVSATTAVWRRTWYWKSSHWGADVVCPSPEVLRHTRRRIRPVTFATLSAAVDVDAVASPDCWNGGCSWGGECYSGEADVSRGCGHCLCCCLLIQSLCVLVDGCVVGQGEDGVHVRGWHLEGLVGSHGC